MRSPVAVALTTLSVGLYAGLLLRVGGEKGPELEVVVEPGARAAVRAARRVTLSVDGAPQASASRLPAGEPGLHTATWSVRFLGRPPRSVSHSYLTGPLARPGAWIPGAARVSLAEALLDDGDERRSGDLSAALGKLARMRLAAIPELARHLGRPSSSRVRLGVGRTTLGVAAVLGFGESGEESYLLVGARFRFAVEGGRLSLRRQGDVLSHLGGHAREQAHQRAGLLGRLLLLLFKGKTVDDLVDEKTSEAAQTAVDRLAAELERSLARFLGRRLTLDLLHPALRLEVRPAAVQLEKGRAIHVLFDARVAVAAGGVGPVRIGGPLPARAALAGDVRIDLGADLVNAVVHGLWRNGALNRLAGAERSLSRITTAEVRRLLGFRIERVRLGLPPTIGRWSSRRARLSVGAVELELSPVADAHLPRLATLHGAVELRPRIDPDRPDQLHVGVRPAPLLVSCGRGTRADPLRPCLTGLVGVANGFLARKGPLDLSFSLGQLSRRGAGPLAVDVTPRRVVVEPGAGSSALRVDLGVSVVAP